MSNTLYMTKCATCRVDYFRSPEDPIDCPVCSIAKAAAFDWIAAQSNVEWDADIHTLLITSPDNELTSFAAPTLIEAVRLAMEAEGER